MGEVDPRVGYNGDTGGGESLGSASDEKSHRFRLQMLRRAGLMRGRRYLAEPELDVHEPAIEGVGEGLGDDGRLPDFSEK